LSDWSCAGFRRSARAIPNPPLSGYATAADARAMHMQPHKHVVAIGIGALLVLAIVPFFIQPASAERVNDTHAISLAELERDSLSGSPLRTMGAGGASLALMFPAPPPEPAIPRETGRERPDRFATPERPAR
jgi:hypothetical protein